MNVATTKLMLSGRPLSNNEHRVYLRVTKDRKKKLISLGLQCKKEYFKDEAFTKKHPNYKIENDLLLEVKTKANKIIRELQLTSDDFTLEDFEDAFRGKKNNQNLKVIDFFDEIIDEMKRAGRVSNAKAYNDTKVSLIKFKGKEFKFKDIDSTFLEKYEVFLKENGSKNGGVAFRMRELRAIINKARKRKLILKEPYPFADYKISKLKSNPKKRALDLEEFEKFKNADLSDYPYLKEAHDYFLFSVYARGMNFQDMMHLKWSNIQNGRIYYTRSKTKGSINLEIIPPAQKILDLYKAQKRPTQYVFPILLDHNLTHQQIAYRKQKVLARYNKKLKEIAELVGIKKNLSSYVARHSFATILKMSGTPVEKISEMMGHADISITIAYLKEFSDEDLDKENRIFTNL